MLVRRPCMPGQHCNYVLEPHGELLWVSVQFQWIYACRYPFGSKQVRTVSVLVHTLEEASAPEKVRWIRKDVRSLADRVLFLGSPNSFAVDAASLHGCHGGCAYFVHHRSKNSKRSLEDFGVFRYNLVHRRTEFIERLPPEWDNEKCTWVIPQPIIAPILEINERTLEAPKQKQQQQKIVTVTSPTRVIHIERHYEPSFRVLVRNLPLSVEEYQLECFFKKHGKVSSSEIICYKNTKISQGMGIITMATMHAHQEDALSALQGLVLDGCLLEVTLVNVLPTGHKGDAKATVGRPPEQLSYM